MKLDASKKDLISINSEGTDFQEHDMASVSKAKQLRYQSKPMVGLEDLQFVIGYPAGTNLSPERLLAESLG